jgi:glycosyltransferase involved in cell wall biosynthesis
MINSRVVVVVPCFNSQNTLGQTLDSVLRQSFLEFCVVAVNDGSTDRTENVLEEYSKRYPKKLLVISQRNQGQTVAKNVGLKNTQSEFVAFIDSDDLWAHNKLEKQVALLAANPNVDLCYTAAHQIDVKGSLVGRIRVSPTHRGRCVNELITNNNIVASSVMVRRIAVDRAGLFDESLPACENWDLWIRIARNCELDYIDEPLTSYRLHPNNMSKNYEKIMQARLRVIDKHLPAGSDDPWIRQQRQAALYKAHFNSAKSYIESLRLTEARSELAKVLRIKPMKTACYVLYLKTLLGPKVFARVRAMHGGQ